MFGEKKEQRGIYGFFCLSTMYWHGHASTGAFAMKTCHCACHRCILAIPPREIQQNSATHRRELLIALRSSSLRILTCFFRQNTTGTYAELCAKEARGCCPATRPAGRHATQEEAAAERQPQPQRAHRCSSGLRAQELRRLAELLKHSLCCRLNMASRKMTIRRNPWSWYAGAGLCCTG